MCVGSACLGALGTWNFQTKQDALHGCSRSACVGQGLLELRYTGVNPCPGFLLPSGGLAVLWVCLGRAAACGEWARGKEGVCRHRGRQKDGLCPLF